MTMRASVSGMNETHYIFIMSSSTNSFGTLFVEVMDLVKCLLLVIILNYVSTQPSHSDQHEDAFHSILGTLKLNNTLLRLQDVNVILTRLGIHDCSNATKHKVQTCILHSKSLTLYALKMCNFSTNSFRSPYDMSALS
jgi:hypothetical protein